MLHRSVATTRSQGFRSPRLHDALGPEPSLRRKCKRSEAAFGRFGICRGPKPETQSFLAFGGGGGVWHLGGSLRGGDCGCTYLLGFRVLRGGRDGCTLFALLKGACAQTVDKLTLKYRYTHRPLSSSFLGLPYRIPKRNYFGAYG